MKSFLTASLLSAAMSVPSFAGGGPLPQCTSLEQCRQWICEERVFSIQAEIEAVIQGSAEGRKVINANQTLLEGFVLQGGQDSEISMLLQNYRAGVRSEEFLSRYSTRISDFMRAHDMQPQLHSVSCPTGYAVVTYPYGPTHVELIQSGGRNHAICERSLPNNQVERVSPFRVTSLGVAESGFSDPKKIFASTYMSLQGPITITVPERLRQPRASDSPLMAEARRRFPLPTNLTFDSIQVDIYTHLGNQNSMTDVRAQMAGINGMNQPRSLDYISSLLCGTPPTTP